MKTQMILLVMNFCIVAIATEVYKSAGSALRHNVSPILKDTQQPVPYTLPNRTTVLPPHEPKPLPRKLPWNPPALHPTMPEVAPSRLSAPAPHKSRRPSNNAPAPFELFPKPLGKKRVDGPAYPPSVSFFKHHHAKGRASNIAPSPSYYLSPRTSDHQGPVILRAPSPTPTVLPNKGRQKYHGPSPLNQGHVSPIQSPFPSTESPASAAPFLYPTLQGGQSESPVIPSNISPSMPSLRKPKAPVPSPVRALPPPPPNQDCTSMTCIEPLTNTPPESHCGCVWPLQVGLRVNVALYTFFPLVSELANEIAAGVFLKKSQVRIMGANAASEKQDKTLVLIDLVPLGEKFDNTTAFLTYQKFWHKQVNIKTDFFGDYEVLYVRYPGLPPSPPLAQSSITAINGEPYTSRGSNGRTIKPLGVDIRRRQKDGTRHSMIVIIVLASSITVFLCIGAACLVLLKHRNRAHNPTPTPQALRPSFAKLSGATGLKMFGSDRSFASPSFGSSIATYTISSKTFNADEIKRATDNFNDSRILGEGGFGRVYSANLDDGTKVAVKVLKRDDHQGDREFVAEVEMLSRLHHKNLVKLIGICTEDNTRCLVYELVPNGSVESHLHGLDKKTSPLDWPARMKIALGAARGLAYLHEDSSPCVIHRDFKSSNILLEHDFTPKVSDFGLARTALDEGNKHISTRVMGTFGYVAPEYAMTGHLLVKSDVYSYGVVLLELLTGRKPVDMTQPQGQENLVSWARPLLATTDGLETIIDPSLGPKFPFNNVVKVAAIASMCVQPEVSHRPFMGEVVQALKLVYSEFDETKEAQSGGFGQEDWSIDMDARISIESGMHSGNSHTHFTNSRALSPSDISNVSTGLWREESDSFRRHSTSGPLQTGSGQFWQRLRGLSRGSISEHGVALRLWAGRR